MPNLFNQSVELGVASVAKLNIFYMKDEMVLSAALIDWLAHSPGYQTKALGRLFSASFPRSATGCPRLRYLSLDCCVSVTDQALWYLLQHNPNVQVLLSFVAISYPKLGSGLLGAT